MARVAWVFDNYAWPVNPIDDSGWTTEHNLSELSPIKSARSTFQHGSTKSARRTVGGHIWGINSVEHFNKLDTWQKQLKQSVLVDHLGRSRQAMLIRFEARPVKDVHEWLQGRQAYQYTAEFVALD